MVLYIITDTLTEMSKIGMTEDRVSLGRRLKDLQVGCPGRLTVVGFVEGSGYQDEKEWHQIFRHKRVRGTGEWFALTNDDIDRILKVPRQPSADTHPDAGPKKIPEPPIPPILPPIGRQEQLRQKDLQYSRKFVLIERLFAELEELVDGEEERVRILDKLKRKYQKSLVRFDYRRVSSDDPITSAEALALEYTQSLTQYYGECSMYLQDLGEWQALYAKDEGEDLEAWVKEV